MESLRKFSEDFPFSDLDPSHELYSEDVKNFVGKYKVEIATELGLYAAIFLGNRLYSIDMKQNSLHCNHK